MAKRNVQIHYYLLRLWARQKLGKVKSFSHEDI